MLPPLPTTTPDFAAIEKQILEYWQKNHVLDQYLHLNDQSSKHFSFIDGPITANNPMGVHHARGRTLKDVFQRYKNLTGHQQRFQNGFDCQGLWVEVEVEKEAGFNSKKDIHNFGLDNFTRACLARVDKFSHLQTLQSQQLGMFMDWDNSYYTNSLSNNLYIWYFLKQIHLKGWLTKKKSATTWCPRCETGLSQHEEADGYKEITDQSVFVKFKLKDRPEYVLAWTTTPWTLSANVLLAINTQFQYVKGKINGDDVILAKSAADRLGITETEPIDATSLLNQEYLPLYQIPAQEGVRHYITNWDQVDPVEGTGIVHIAPGCGQEDFELGKQLGTDMIAPLDETGHFLPGFGDLSGLYAHDVTPLVIKHLEDIGALFKIEPITHRYPHCWRCKTKCLFRLENNWYIKSDQIRPLLKEAAKKVNWQPKYIGRRMQNWLDSMEDWMISRKRFYGLCLPFYECSCGHLTVVGSKEELQKLALKPELVDKLTSMHRPWVDEVQIKCPSCGQPVSRVPDVGDCWLDAGVVPFSTLKYLEDKEYWRKWFPADLVLEMTEQVRLWFYSMLFFSVVFENRSPYINVVTHADVRDEKGDPIHKTKKNGIPFDDAISKMGADSMRWLYCQQKSHSSVNFGYAIADQVKRDFILILFNSFRFYTQHCQLQNYTPEIQSSVPKSDNPLDLWLISRLHHTISAATKHLDHFHPPAATKAIADFVTDLSTWYIRRSRQRIDHLPILQYVFDQLFILCAPFIPFLSDYLYLQSHPKSVHLSSWPTADQSLINPQLESDMTLLRQLASLIHAKRQEASLSLRQPLSLATISSSAPKLPDQLIGLLLEETNIKNITWDHQPQLTSPQVTLDTTITDDLAAEGEFRQLVRLIQSMRKDIGLSPQDTITISCPSWPKSFEAEILAKTNSKSISVGPTLTINHAQ